MNLRCRTDQLINRNFFKKKQNVWKQQCGDKKLSKVKFYFRQKDAHDKPKTEDANLKMPI